MDIGEIIRFIFSNKVIKAKIKEDIKLKNGIILKSGTVSNFLYKKENNIYHFEYKDIVLEIEEGNLVFISQKYKIYTFRSSLQVYQ